MTAENDNETEHYYPQAKYGGKCALCGDIVNKGSPIWIGSNRAAYCTKHGLPEIGPHIRANPAKKEPVFEDDLIEELRGIRSALDAVALALQKRVG